MLYSAVENEDMVIIPAHKPLGKGEILGGKICFKEFNCSIFTIESGLSF